MSDADVPARLAHLRGSLPAEEPGARGIEHVARNPACQRLRALTMAGVSPATAVAEVYGENPREGQSPFALAAGNRFERRLMENGAAELLALYRAQGRLSTCENRVAVITEEHPGTSPSALAQRRTLTEQLILGKLAGDTSAPNVIVKARIPVQLLGVDHIIEPDVLVAADTDQFYRPVEVKSYPDRAGKTDPADIRGACRQAAVAVVALRQGLERLGFEDIDNLVPSIGDLVLHQPGSYRQTLRPMTLRGEVHSLLRVLKEAPRNLDELELLLTEVAHGGSLDNPAVLDAIPNHYVEGCREHCTLAQKCKQQALACCDPVILGGFAREELAGAGSVKQTLKLLHGGKTTTADPQQEALAARLQAAMHELKAAVGNGS